MLSERSSPSIHLAPLPDNNLSERRISQRLANPELGTRVLLAISLAQNVEPNVTSWINWLNTDKAPAEILKIDARIESAYDSHSTLILFSVPTVAWSRMADRDAYNFIGFVRSENLLKVSNSQDLKAAVGPQRPSLPMTPESLLNHATPPSSIPLMDMPDRAEKSGVTEVAVPYPTHREAKQIRQNRHTLPQQNLLKRLKGRDHVRLMP